MSDVVYSGNLVVSVSVHVATGVVSAGGPSCVNDLVHFSHLYLEAVDPVIRFNVPLLSPLPYCHVS